MKNNIKFFIAAVIAGMLFSCEENELPQFDDVNGVTLAQFGSSSEVLATPEEGASTEVEVIVTTISDQQREIEVSVDPESTASPDQYDISNLVIPANSYTGTITITSNYDALPELGNSILILNLEGVGDTEGIVENGELTIEMFRTCPIVKEELVGTWRGTTAWGYNTEVVTFLNEDGDLMINGLTFGWFQDWWSEVIITNEPVMMEVNEETGEITIPQQFYITSTYNGAPQDPYDIKGSGMVLNPCTRTIEISPVLVQAGNAIDGSAWGPSFKEVITLP